MKHVARCTVCLSLALGMAACAQPPRPTMVEVCDPVCSMRPVDQVNQELRDTGRENDGRMAALEAEAERNPRAAYDLALRYFRGDGVRRDSYKALTWMRVAGENGNLNAQKALGRLYLTGLEEMGRDPREARTWLSLAANKGDRESKRLLAQAEAATRSLEAENKVLSQWRPQVYNMWHSGYVYYGKWNGRAWMY
ncbi:MAG: sel1 repeat family protein [Proteobacteria bacterium]|nr:sel1 repeat family protein [Pseudomonadota bacterium]